jgi:hypothetical protein
VIVDSADDPFVVQLQPADERTTQVIIKNHAEVTLRVTPDGVDTIDAINAYFEIPPITIGGVPYPSATLLSDGVSDYEVVSAVKIV